MKKAVFGAFIIHMIVAVNFVWADSFGTGSNQFIIDFVPISGSTNPTSGYGIVNYDYCIGTYEITNYQWNKFKASYGIVTGNPSTAYDSEPYWTSTYVPANNVSWYEAAQFVNWLNISTNHSPAYKFTGTQGTADYTFVPWDVGDTGYNPMNPFRNNNAYYVLPTEDEWVKAAYWNGISLQTYATKAGDTLFQGNGTSGTGWNYYDDSSAINPSCPWAVGSGSQELNGTYDMMGNVFEWTESCYFNGDYNSGSRHAVRGGSYAMNGSFLSPSYRGSPLLSTASMERIDRGFRIASVPEPATISLLGLGLLVLRRK